MKFALSSFALLVACSVARAQMDVGIEYVTVGHPGNPHDPFTGNVRGGVGYVFKIAKFEVTNAQYVAFLNNADSLGGNLRQIHNNAMASGDYPITRDLSRPVGQKYSVAPGGENFPVSNVDYYSTLRFANWLHGGNTEDGAYGITSQAPPLDTIPRKSTAQFWIPNWNEWYKAAYYHGPDSSLFPLFGTDYAIFPMGGFSANSNVPPGNAGSANYNGVSGKRAVGSFPFAVSFYGTYDQGGNVEEWFEHLPGAGLSRFLGGSYTSSEAFLRSSNNANTSTTGEADTRGFRVAARVSPQPVPVIPNLEAHQAVELRWQSQAGVTYRVQYSTDLTSWFDDGASVSGTGLPLSAFRKLDSTRKFYRVVIQQ